MTGYLAYSLAGHDKGEVYLITGEDDGCVYAVNGRSRTVDRPKRKNKKHMQVIKKAGRITDISSVTNEETKRLIKLYCRGIKEDQSDVKVRCN